ncbi:MAG: hypothetical protein IIY70_05930 [Oscillospiraceae bacterium]|nr:hypothetical protein [Oscillospiraceae bacterium]
MVGPSQKISNSAPDPEQIKRLLTSPEGQALIRLLQSDGGAGLQQAASAIRRGDTEQAKAVLEPLLAGTQGEALSKKLEEQL